MNDLKKEEPKQPWHIDIAEKLFSEFNQFNHKEQVEVFQYIQGRLIGIRQEQAKEYENENMHRSADLNLHIDGTKTIASGV